MGRRGLCEKLVVPRGSHPSPPQDPVVDMVSLGSRQSHLPPPHHHHISKGREMAPGLGRFVITYD